MGKFFGATFQSREPKPLHPKPRIPFLGFGRKPGPTRFIGDARKVVFRPTYTRMATKSNPQIKAQKDPAYRTSLTSQPDPKHPWILGRPTVAPERPAALGEVCFNFRGMGVAFVDSGQPVEGFKKQSPGGRYAAVRRALHQSCREIQRNACDAKLRPGDPGASPTRAWTLQKLPF